MPSCWRGDVPDPIQKFIVVRNVGGTGGRESSTYAGLAL